MKKLTKIMLSLAAASVMTAAMAVTAMAVDTIEGTYNNETGLVTLTEGTVALSGKSQTILVLDNNVAEGAEKPIAYINQIDNNGKFSTFMLAAGLQSTTPVTYDIKIGGSDKSLQTGTLTIAADAPATVTIIIGDANGDGRINGTDINRIGRYIHDDQVSSKATGNTGIVKYKADGTEVVIGDANGDGRINGTDINRIGRYIHDDQVSSKATGNTGFEVDVVDEAAAE